MMKLFFSVFKNGHSPLRRHVLVKLKKWCWIFLKNEKKNLLCPGLEYGNYDKPTYNSQKSE